MLKLREQGKIRASGVSVLDTHPAIVADRMHSVQLIFK
jgi:hypothetical protein